MNRVATWLTRGIVASAVLLGGGPLADPPPSPLAHALELVRSQDFTPVFELAGRRIGDYFDPRKEEAFIEEVFSLGGKWRAVTRGRESYERYVRRVFEERVFTPRDFDRILDQIRKDYDYEIAAAENRLLVALFRDLRPARPGLTFEAFQGEYASLAASLAPHVVRDLGMNLVSWAGSDAAAVLLVAALNSAGILGTSVAAGSAGGPVTLGISLVVGIAAGIALDAIVGGVYEEAAREELRLHVNRLRNRTIDSVHEALVRTILAYRMLEERCIVELYQGGEDVRLAGRP
jgi:hypothetical protein